MKNDARVFIITEIGQAHDGSLGILHSLIEAIAPLDIDAIKFQLHIADAQSSEFEPFRTNFSYVDKTRRDYWRRMEFTAEQWAEVKRHCEDRGKEFLASPFSCAAVDVLEGLGAKRYKIASGEVANFLMLDKIARIGKPMIISTGMSDFDGIGRTIDFLGPINGDLSILQCTTEYPTPAERIGINVISELRKRFGIPVGISDHSGTVFPAIAAVAVGAEIVETHVTFDKRMFGPDAASSLDPDNLARMVEGVRFIEKAVANPVDKTDASAYAEIRRMFGKSLAVARDLEKNHVVAAGDLEAKRPAGKGIPADDFMGVLGRKTVRPKTAFDFLEENDLA